MKKFIYLAQYTKRKALPLEKEIYQAMTGLIMFSIVENGPDIAFITSLVSYFIKNPSHQHTEAVKTILKYPKDLKNRKIIYGGEEELKIKDYSKSD